MRYKLIWLIAIAGSVSPTPAQDLTGEEIIKKVNEIINPGQMQASLKMTIQTTSGQSRTFIYESFTKNRGEKNLIRYLEPARSRGQAILMLNHADDIWAYFPRTKRVRKLAEHAKRQKMEGSDFSYEDMGSGETFGTDFDALRLPDETAEGRKCFQVELTKKVDSGAGYSRLIMWIDKENYVPLVIDYYNLKDPDLKEKRLVQSAVEIIQGLPTAKKLVMSNVMDNTETSMEILSVDYEVNIDDELFTERGLRE